MKDQDLFLEQAGEKLMKSYLELPLDIAAYLVNDQDASGKGIEGFNRGDKVHINSCRIFKEGKIIYFIDGNIHGYYLDSFKRV